MAALAFTAFGVHWFALGWNRIQNSDVRLNVGMSFAFTVLSILGIIVFFSVHDNPVGGVFISLAGVYATEFFASMMPDHPRMGRLAMCGTGIFRIGTGLWLMYLTFAVALNFILNYNLPL